MGIHECFLLHKTSILYSNTPWRGRGRTETVFTLASTEKQVVDLSHDSVVLAEKDEGPFFASIFLC